SLRRLCAPTGPAPRKQREHLMAKSSKSARTDRQKVVEEMRAKQKAAERRRGTIIVAACVLVAVGIVAAAAIGPILDHVRTSKFSSKPLSDIGAAAAGCQPGTTH